MFKAILIAICVVILWTVFWFPVNTVETVRNFWQSNFVKSSVTYAETNGVPVSKVLPKEFSHRHQSR